MCNYFKKLHPCNCLSRIQIDRCVSACQTNKICVVPVPDDATFRETSKRSYIDCFDCIKKAVEAERDHVVVAAATTAVAINANDAARQRELAEQRELKAAKLEQNRRIAEEKMRAEREEDRKREEQLRREREEEKKEGGHWVDVGSARKKKGGKGTYGPKTAFPRMGGGAANGAMGGRPGIPSFAPLNTSSGAASAPPSAYFGGNRMGGFRKESEVFKKDNKTGKDYETSKKFNEPTKKDNEASKKENQPMRKDIEPSKRGSEATKKENEPIKTTSEPTKNENEPMKKGNETIKKGSEATTKYNEAITKGPETNKKENQPTASTSEPSNSNVTANVSAPDRGRAGVWGRKGHGHGHGHGHGNTVPKKILTKSDNATHQP